MAILESEIWVTIAPCNLDHYINFKYSIPKRINNRNKEVYILGSKILVPIHHLSSGSSIKLTKICDECGENILNQAYSNIMCGRQFGDGKDRCSNCFLVLNGKKRKNNIPYEKSLEYYTKENNKVYLLEEFSIKNFKKPNEVTYANNDKYIWTCPIFGVDHEYSATVGQRSLLNRGCPYCSGRKVNHTNSLSTTHPELSKQWSDKLNGDLTPDMVSRGSNKKIWWQCEYNHPPFHSVINNRTFQNQSCPICAESKGEIKVRAWLQDQNILFTSQKTYSGLKGLGGGLLSYDFSLPEYNMLIEYQGEFHDGFGRKYVTDKLESQIEHDRRKKEFANRNGIELFEIWYWDFENVELILKNKICNSHYQNKEMLVV